MLDHYQTLLSTVEEVRKQIQQSIPILGRTSLSIGITVQVLEKDSLPDLEWCIVTSKRPTANAVVYGFVWIRTSKATVLVESSASQEQFSRVFWKQV